MRIRPVLLTGVAVLSLGLLLVSPIAAAIRVNIEGTKQGVFKSEATGREPASLRVNSYGYEVTSPRDPATGQASGKRTHRPVEITRPIGAASPQLFQALCTNEVLKTVQIDITPPSSDAVLYRIKLVNATVSNIIQFTADDGQVMERVSFTFQRIEVEHPDGKTMAVDDWFQKS